jgi:hypothetical protein
MKGDYNRYISEYAAAERHGEVTNEAKTAY